MQRASSSRAAASYSALQRAPASSVRVSWPLARPAPGCMRRSVAALLPRAPPLQRWSLSPPLRACASASGPEERVVHSLADSSGAAVTELDLSGGRGGAHEDLVCVNIMCEHVGGVCVCRLSRVLERPSLQSLHTLRLAGNGCARCANARLLLTHAWLTRRRGATGSAACLRACGSCASCECSTCAITNWRRCPQKDYSSWTCWTCAATRCTLPGEQETRAAHDTARRWTRRTAPWFVYSFIRVAMRTRVAHQKVLASLPPFLPSMTSLASFTFDAM